MKKPNVGEKSRQMSGWKLAKSRGESAPNVGVVEFFILECDAVVHLRDGRYGLIEIKLGGEDSINHGAKTLLTLAKKIDTTKMKAPSFLMVVTAVGDYAYRREDGVLVVPIGSLRD